MTEWAQRKVQEVLRARRESERPPEIRELEDAIEELLRRCAPFEGDSDLAVRLGVALSNVENRLIEFKTSEKKK